MGICSCGHMHSRTRRRFSVCRTSALWARFFQVDLQEREEEWGINTQRGNPGQGHFAEIAARGRLFWGERKKEGSRNLVATKREEPWAPVTRNRNQIHQRRALAATETSLKREHSFTLVFAKCLSVNVPSGDGYSLCYLVFLSEFGCQSQVVWQKDSGTSGVDQEAVVFFLVMRQDAELFASKGVGRIEEFPEVGQVPRARSICPSIRRVPLRRPSWGIGWRACGIPAPRSSTTAGDLPEDVQAAQSTFWIGGFESA